MQYRQLVVTAAAVTLAGCGMFEPDWDEADGNCPWPEGTELSWVGHGNPVDAALRAPDPAQGDHREQAGAIYVSASPIHPDPDVIAPQAERQWCWVVAEGGGVDAEIGGVRDGWAPP